MEKSLFLDLFEKAKAVQKNSYSPYSGCAVSAALQTTSGKIFSGVNVENSSYGASVCAERTALLKAVSEEGKTEIQRLLVLTDFNPPWPPCGICRQVISEFIRNPQIPVALANGSGIVDIIPFSELLPRSFSRDQFNQAQTGKKELP